MNGGLGTIKMQEMKQTSGHRSGKYLKATNPGTGDRAGKGQARRAMKAEAQEVRT